MISLINYISIPILLIDREAQLLELLRSDYMILHILIRKSGR